MPGRRVRDLGPSAGKPGNEAERALDDLLGWLNLARIDDFVQAGLHEALTSVINRIHGIGDAIHRTYFDQRDSLAPPEAAEEQARNPVLAATVQSGQRSFAPERSPPGIIVSDQSAAATEPFRLVASQLAAYIRQPAGH